MSTLLLSGCWLDPCFFQDWLQQSRLQAVMDQYLAAKPYNVGRACYTCVCQPPHHTCQCFLPVIACTSRECPPLKCSFSSWAEGKNKVPALAFGNCIANTIRSAASWDLRSCGKPVRHRFCCIFEPSSHHCRPHKEWDPCCYIDGHIFCTAILIAVSSGFGALMLLMEVGVF